MANHKKFVHVLISASYEDQPLPSHTVSHAVSHWFNTLTQLNTITTYQMPYPISPMDCSLKEQWSKFDEEEIEIFTERYPELATAIALMCGGDDEGEPGTSSSKESGGTIRSE